MRAFELRLNEAGVIVIGAPSSVPSVTLIATKGGTRGAPIHLALLATAQDPAGGHLIWETRSLSIGDIVSIRPVEANAADPPLERTRFAEPYWSFRVRHARRSIRRLLDAFHAHPRRQLAAMLRAPLMSAHRILFDTTARARVAFELQVCDARICVAGLPMPGTTAPPVVGTRAWTFSPVPA